KEYMAAIAQNAGHACHGLGIDGHATAGDEADRFRLGVANATEVGKGFGMASQCFLLCGSPRSRLSVCRHPNDARVLDRHDRPAPMLLPDAGRPWIPLLRMQVSGRSAYMLCGAFVAFARKHPSRSHRLRRCSSRLGWGKSKGEYTMKTRLLLSALLITFF